MSTARAAGSPALVVANFSETFPGHHGKSGIVATNPLALVPDGSTYVLVRTVDEVAWADHDGVAAATIALARGSLGLSSAVLSDRSAMDRLGEALAQAGPTRLYFQVWSEDLGELVRELERRGVAFDDESIPSVSGATVAYWNSKRGGRELLWGVPGLRDHLPPAGYYRDAMQLERALVTRTEPCLVKSNASLGGEGMVLLVPGERAPAWVSMDHRNTGWLVEDLVGDPVTNLSPTVDYLVSRDVEFRGIGLQALEGHLAYAGVREVPEVAAYRQPCIDLGHRIAEELQRRGYRGPVNVDFVVTATGRIVIAEINVRQSAPLEVFTAVRRTFGSGWTSASFRSEHLVGTPAVRPGPVEIRRADDGAEPFREFATVLGANTARPGAASVTVAWGSSSCGRLDALAQVLHEHVGTPTDLPLDRLPLAPEAPDVTATVDEEPLVAGEGAGPSRQVQLARRMRAVASRFRAENPLSRPVAETGSYAIPISWGGSPEAKPVAWFASPGCAWSLSGGCTMCDFSADESPATVEQAAADFVDHLQRLDPDTKRIHLGPGGSFFDDREVPAPLRGEVLRSCAVLPALRSVGLETRPGLVSFDKLMHAVEALPAGVADLTLGFGLECLDPLVREVAINKGYNTHHIDRAIAVIDDVNAAQSRVHVDFEIYVLLKPLFLTEQEAIDEAVRTIKWSFGRGATTVAMFLNTIKRNTVQGYLASLDDLEGPYRFEAPYYRSAIDVLLQLSDQARSKTIVLGTQSGVMAEGQPSGCPLCTPLMLGTVMAFNFTKEAAILQEAARSWCPCRPEWERSLLAEAPPMIDRLDHGISILEATFPEVQPRPQPVRLRAQP